MAPSIEQDVFFFSAYAKVIIISLGALDSRQEKTLGRTVCWTPWSDCMYHCGHILWKISPFAHTIQKLHNMHVHT